MMLGTVGDEESSVVFRYSQLSESAKGLGFTLSLGATASAGGGLMFQHKPFGLVRGTWGPVGFDNLDQIEGFLRGWVQRGLEGEKKP